jgi:hypothetical protein
MTTNTTEPHHVDPHGLLASGEPLATVPELARTIGCSSTALRRLLGGPLYEMVHFVGGGAGVPWRYSIADARTAFEPCRARVEERRRVADERQAAERAAKAAKKSAAPATKPAKAPPSTRPDRSATSRRGTSAPEVFVRRARA